MSEQTTTGQALTAALRRYFSIGTRTRRYRKSSDLHRAMIEAVMYAAQYPGFYTQATQDALHPGFGAALAYEKHVQGYRIDGVLAHRINDMSPWQFAALLGQMVDAGVQNTGTGEHFFREMAKATQH